MTQVRDEELEQYFDSMKELWDMPQFQVFVSEFQKQIPNINSVEQTKPGDYDLGIRAGQMNVIRTIENLRDNIEVLESGYLAELESDAAEDEDTDIYKS